jgi:hypothetical protein
MSLTKVTRATTLIKDGWGAFNTLIDDLLSVASGKGASQVGIYDSAGNMSATNVEDALAEVYTDHSTTKALAETFDENSATTTGLVWGYKGGLFRLDAVVTTVAAGTIALTDDVTNYLEIDPDDGLVKKNTTSFTSGRIPIRTVLTASGSQTTNTDKRAWFSQVAGATTTTSGIMELATDAETITGTVTDRVVTPANIVARAASVSTIATDPIWAAAGDLVQGTGNDAAAVLSLGAANLKAFVNAGATAIEWAGGIKIGTFARTLSDADGTQAISGIGFKPSHVIFLGAIDDSKTYSIGFDDGTSRLAVYSNDYNIADTWGAGTTISIELINVSGESHATITTLGSDGFTLTWVKSGSSTGVAELHYIAFR